MLVQRFNTSQSDCSEVCIISSHQEIRKYTYEWEPVNDAFKLVVYKSCLFVNPPLCSQIASQNRTGDGEGSWMNINIGSVCVWYPKWLQNKAMEVIHLVCLKEDEQIAAGSVLSVSAVSVPVCAPTSRQTMAKKRKAKVRAGTVHRRQKT